MTRHTVILAALLGCLALACSGQGRDSSAASVTTLGTDAAFVQDTRDYLNPVGRDEFVRRAMTQPLAFDPGDRRMIMHNGGNGIFFADMVLLPDDGLVLFVQTNVAADLPVVERLLELIGARLFEGRPYPAVPAVIEQSASEVGA